mgnify:CR=1 FL=1
MPSDIVIKDDFTGLDKLEKNLKSQKVAKVGIFGNKNARDDDTTNVKVGMKHEFGSFSEGLPRRSFLKDPLALKRKEFLKRARKIIDKDISDSVDSDQILEKIGVLGETIVQEAFETGGFGTWKPISRSGSILIDTGQLRSSITSKVEKL